jgi:multiple sugar transport system ATP-binding protein
MREGTLQQVDSPDGIYRFPANLFVADFIGNPKVNLLEGQVDGSDCVDLGSFLVNVRTRGATGKVVVAVRPEDIAISTEPVAGAVEFSAYSVLPAGADSTIVARRGSVEITVKVIGISKIKMDDRIWLGFNRDTLNLYDKESGSLVVAKAEQERSNSIA